MAAVYPTPAQVLLGVEYGPNGDDYTGTLEVGTIGAGAAFSTIQAIRALLLSLDGLTALTSTRIYCGGAPGADDLFPCVTFQRVGGMSDLWIGDRVTVTADLNCWADSAVEADALYAQIRALAGRNQIIVGDYCFDAIIEALGGTDVPEQVTPARQLHRVLATYEFTISRAPS